MQGSTTPTSGVRPTVEASQEISRVSRPSRLTLTSVAFTLDARVSLIVLLVGVIGYGATTLLDSNAGWSAQIGQWLYPSLMLAAAVRVAARARSNDDERLAWWLIAAGMTIPAVRNFLYPALGSLNTLRPLW